MEKQIAFCVKASGLDAFARAGGAGADPDEREGKGEEKGEGEEEKGGGGGGEGGGGGGGEGEEAGLENKIQELIGFTGCDRVKAAEAFKV